MKVGLRYITAARKLTCPNLSMFCSPSCPFQQIMYWRLFLRAVTCTKCTWADIQISEISTSLGTRLLIMAPVLNGSVPVFLKTEPEKNNSACYGKHDPLFFGGSKSERVANSFRGSVLSSEWKALDPVPFCARPLWTVESCPILPRVTVNSHQRP